jgi:hypothetical protein
LRNEKQTEIEKEKIIQKQQQYSQRKKATIKERIKSI